MKKASKYLTFSIGQRTFAISIKNVVEILGLPEITDVPDTPEYMKGVINLRDGIIPIIDLRLRFGLAESENRHHLCIIVIETETEKIAIIVDAVGEVKEIPVELLQGAKQHLLEESSVISDMVKVDAKVILIVDANKILTADFHLPENAVS